MVDLGCGEGEGNKLFNIFGNMEGTAVGLSRLKKNIEIPYLIFKQLFKL